MRDSSIAELNLSNRTFNALSRANIHTISQLKTIDDNQLLSIRGLGKKGLTEIREKLEAWGDVRYDLAELGLSSKVFEVLTKANIHTINQLRLMNDKQLLNIKGLGGGGFFEVKEKMKIWEKSHCNKSSERLGFEATQPEVLLELIQSALSDKWYRILQLRFGSAKIYTLEEIGKLLGLSRERIRQIEGAILRRMSHHSRQSKIRPFADVLVRHCMHIGGLFTEKEAIDIWRKQFGEKNCYLLTRLILHVDKRFELVKKELWGISWYPLKSIFLIQKELRRILAEVRVPLSTEELLARFDIDKYERADEAFILACARKSESIVQRNDGTWGLKKWERGYHYQVIEALRRLGYPAHYTEIAEVINSSRAPDQKINPKIIHAYLIQHKDIFVWAGRDGVYGLAEWGIPQIKCLGDAVYYVLDREKKPLPIDVLIERVSRIWDARPESIRTAIQIDDRFVKVGDKIYLRDLLGSTYYDNLSEIEIYKERLASLQKEIATYKEKDDIEDQIKKLKSIKDLLK